MKNDHAAQHDTLRTEQRANHVLYTTFENSRHAPTAWRQPSRIKTRPGRFASLRDLWLRLVRFPVDYVDALCWLLSAACFLITAYFIWR